MAKFLKVIGYLLVRTFGSKTFVYNTHAIYEYRGEFYRAYYIRIERVIPIKVKSLVKSK